MPANSSPLEFSCVKCGKDYGSIQFLPKQPTGKIERKEKRLLGRPEPDMLRIPKRPELNSVDYSLRNAIIARYEEKQLHKATKVLAELERNGWQFLPLPFSPPLSEADRTTIETYVAHLKSRVEARKIHEQELERKESSWKVAEKVGEIDPSVYEIMQKLSKCVTTTWQIVMKHK